MSSRSETMVSSRSDSSLLLFLGAQIDRAQPLALDLQPFEPPLDIGNLRQGVVGLQPGLADDQMRRRVERLAGCGPRPRGAVRRRRSAALRRGPHLARFGKRLDRRDAQPCRAGPAGFGLLQAVGGGLAQGLGLRKLRHQAATPRFDLVGRVFEPCPLGVGIVAPLVERDDLAPALSPRAIQLTRSAAMAASRRVRCSASRFSPSWRARASASAARSR